MASACRTRTRPRPDGHLLERRDQPAVELDREHLGAGRGERHRQRAETGADLHHPIARRRRPRPRRSPARGSDRSGSAGRGTWWDGCRGGAPARGSPRPRAPAGARPVHQAEADVDDAGPERAEDGERLGREVDDLARAERSSVIDRPRNGPAGLDVGHGHQRAERQRGMRRRQARPRRVVPRRQPGLARRRRCRAPRWCRRTSTRAPRAASRSIGLALDPATDQPAGFDLDR